MPSQTMAEATAVSRRLARALEDIADKKERERINKGAGRFVAAAAAGKAPRSKKPHYAYNTPKIISSRRAKRGSAINFRIKYNPGNLALSLRVLSLKKSIRAIIGPKMLRNPRAKEYGRNRRNVNAYYAQMIYGSAKAFRDKVMIPALTEQESRIRKYIQKETRKLVTQAANRHNLR